MISKSLSTSERRARIHELAGPLAEFTQGLYPLMVAHADDFGRLQGDLFTVKHVIDPSSPRKLEEFGEAVHFLHEVGLIQWYEVEGRKYIQILNFDPHQTGLHRRTESRLPEPSGKFPEIPSELKRTEGKGTEENRTVQDSGSAAAVSSDTNQSSPPTAVDPWRGRQGTKPANDQNFAVIVKIAHEVMDAVGVIDPESPDLVDLVKESCAKARINYSQDPSVVRRAVACAATQKLQPISRHGGRSGGVASMAMDLTGVGPEDLSARLKSFKRGRR